MFDDLKQSIKNFAGLSLASDEEIEDLVKDIQRTLLRSDVEVTLVQDLTKQIKKQALKSKDEIPQGLTRKEWVIKIVYDQLVQFLGEEQYRPQIGPQRILLLGTYGAGKTTTCGKLASFYKKRGLKGKVGLIAADIHRPAAYDQLQQIADKTDAEFYGKKEVQEETGKQEDQITASLIVERGRKKLEDEGCKLIIVDSAGRDSFNRELAEELTAIEQELEPDHKYLVVPADMGQSAGDQAEKFNQGVGITGVIVTKTDSTAKGGGAISSCVYAESNITYIGTGETLDDLKPYNPVDYVSQILGIPNLESLLEKAEETVDQEEAEKFLKGEFTLRDFYQQLEKMGESGIMDQILEQLPIGNKLPDMMDMQEEKIADYSTIMDSMTREEMEDPKLINGSRAERIANGSGTSKKEVRELIKQYRQAKNMMDKFSGKNMRRGNMKQMLNKLGMGKLGL